MINEKEKKQTIDDGKNEPVPKQESFFKKLSSNFKDGGKINAFGKNISDYVKQTVKSNKDEDKDFEAEDENVIRNVPAAKIKEINKLNNSPKGQKDKLNIPGNVIDLIGVWKQYTNRTNIFNIIQDVNFSVKKGELLVIVGPSGAGKSTLLNIMSGLDRPTTGQVIINDINIAALKDYELTKFRRENTGFIFQNYNLLPTLNVLENAKIGQHLQTDKTKRIPLLEILKEINILDKAKNSIDQLSGGEQQRVSIARAISKNPTILFADEPTGALDEAASKSVLELFQKISQKYKTTIVLVTHDLRITKIADRIIEVKNNRIVNICENKNKIKAENLM